VCSIFIGEYTYYSRTHLVYCLHQLRTVHSHML
jgi:hypothetical protein